MANLELLQGIEKIKDSYTKINTSLTNLNNDIINIPHGLYRNAIINGGFNIWQRGTSFTSTGYTADRWRYIRGAGSSAIISQSELSPEEIPDAKSKYYLRWQHTTAGTSGSAIIQRIEDVHTFAGNVVTFSFYAKADNPKNFNVYLTQNFGTGGSSSVITPIQSFTVTTMWSRYAFKFTLPSIVGKTIGPNSYLEVGIFEENNYSTFDVGLAEFQLNTGDVALPFQPRHIAEELELCRRYCQVLGGGEASQGFGAGGYGVSVTSSAAFIFIPLRPRGRIVPSVSASGSFSLNLPGSGNVSVTSLTLNSGLSTPDMVVLQANTSGSLTPGQMGYLQAVDNANARIILDMEL